ncbi:hypothetical protein [Runella sp.]|uniref:hypothetical protein n=1 Tax=Runella sp. TaxID=1960881 RepID=UPI003D1316E0
MKKYIVVAALFALSLQSCKSDVSYDKLPQKVKENFATNVPEAKGVTWEENADYYFAHFTENGEKGLALFYKADGNWVETEKALSLNDLTPEQKESLIKYGNAQIKRLEEVKKNDSTDVIKAEVSK